MNKQKQYIALIFFAWVAVIVVMLMFRDRINVLYYLPLVLLLKIFLVNIRFVKGYTKLAGSESKFHWALPVIMEHSIFSPRYSKITNISLGIVAILGIVSYLLIGLGVEVPGVDFSERESFVSNVIYILVFAYIIYSVVVGLGYVEIDMYVDSVYKDKFPVHKANFYRRWNIIMYFVPVLRMLPMMDVMGKCEKLNSFYNFRMHEESEELV